MYSLSTVSDLSTGSVRGIGSIDVTSRVIVIHTTDNPKPTPPAVYDYETVYT